MLLLTVNTGSSSVKLSLFNNDGADITRIKRTTFSLSDWDQSSISTFVTENPAQSISPGQIVIVHRVVHGGSFTRPCFITNEIEESIDKAAVFAPLHNPSALRGIRSLRETFGQDVQHLAIFDTGFFADLPAIASHYALPDSLTSGANIHRVGFHGLAHEWMWLQCAQQAPSIRKLVTLQLGSGCSAAAILDGKPLDTSMGFTPQEGLVMATRSGDLDPGLLLHLVKTSGLSVDQLESTLNHKSGLFGLSGISGDMQDLLASTEPQARLALDVFCYRARKYLGAYLAVLGGADAIAFGGGIGEHAAEIRSRILEDFSWCGLALEAQRSTRSAQTIQDISSPDSKIRIFVVPIDEERLMAEKTIQLLQSRQ